MHLRVIKTRYLQKTKKLVWNLNIAVPKRNIMFIRNIFINLSRLFYCIKKCKCFKNRLEGCFMYRLIRNEGDRVNKKKSRYKTIPLHPDTYFLLKREKEKLQKNFGRELSWDELIFLLFELKKMLVNDE